ncbi:MAG: hypothetical protein AMXMBFR4_02630 [Candidatus Hydrogenedentota bacterium]
MRNAAMVLLAAIACALACAAPDVRVIIEEDIYTYESPNNGSGPLWSFGCTAIARIGERVFVSQMETGKDIPPLCNTRWRLLERTENGWTLRAEADGFRQREPAVLATDARKTLYLNVNDSIMPPGTQYGACEPHILAFDVDRGPFSPRKLSPQWTGTPTFTDHSYRGYAADPAASQLLMFNIDAETSVQHWCLLSMEGEPLKHGGVAFPIRSCYPQVSLKNGRAGILAIGDIVEPNEEWRAYKFEQTQRKWDYVFRVLYFSSTPDIAAQDFGPPIEIANVDATGGHITNQDLWIAPDGAAHIMYTEREVASPLMRDKFFPGKSTTNSLMLAVVRQGVVAERRLLIPGSEDEQPGHARFHLMPDGTVYALVYISGKQPRNVLMRIHPDLDVTDPVPVPLQTPLSSYLLATERAGNAPSTTIDALGAGRSDNSIAYVQIRLN